MKYQIALIVPSVVAGFISGIALRFVSKEVSEMHDFILYIWDTFWPEVIGCIVFLVVWFVTWNVKFFRTLRSEEEKKFQSSLNDWLSDKNNEFSAITKALQYERKFLSDYVDNELNKLDRKLKCYRESYGERLKKLEENRM